MVACALLLTAAACTPAGAAPPCPRLAVTERIRDAETLIVATALMGRKQAWPLRGCPGPPAASPMRWLASARRAPAGDLASAAPSCLVPDDTGEPEEAADRYGRLPAQVERDDGVWLQGRLLAAGLARVHPTPLGRSRIAEMLAIEDDARASRRGLWRLPSMQIRTADDAGRAPSGLQLIEGRVVDAQRRGDWWYLNFGEDWRRDFTVTIGKQVLPAFAAAGIEPYALKDRTIRVRGILQWRNGAMIDALVPEQIELISAAGG
ncbi:MAG: thermonuclease family protein [Rhodospirillales bacterium]